MPRRFFLLAFALVLIAAGLGASSTQARALTDSEVIRGFNLTVFGAEFAPFGIQSRYVRKFNGPVRFHVYNLSRKDRNTSVKRFILSLNSLVYGLKTQVTNNAGSANFNVYIVDRADYVQVARERIYKRRAAPVPGKCLVRSVFTRNGIMRSDAVIVSDGGEALFQRCMREEILQGLGPLNEHPSLRYSMFNDRSRHTKFTRFDRLILNMLYDRRIRNGDSQEKIQELLPEVLGSAKRRVR